MYARVNLAKRSCQRSLRPFTQPLIAVQIGFDTIRVTFRNVESFRTAQAKSHVFWYCGSGGGPPLTMVHIFDYPAEFSDDPVKQVLSGFGEVRNVKGQKYIGRPDIETGLSCNTASSSA